MRRTNRRDRCFEVTGVPYKRGYQVPQELYVNFPVRGRSHAVGVGVGRWGRTASRGSGKSHPRPCVRVVTSARWTLNNAPTLKIEETHTSRLGCLTLTDKLPSSSTLYRRNGNVLRVTSYVPSDQRFFWFAWKGKLTSGLILEPAFPPDEGRKTTVGEGERLQLIQGIPAKQVQIEVGGFHRMILCCGQLRSPLCETTT